MKQTDPLTKELVLLGFAIGEPAYNIAKRLRMPVSKVEAIVRRTEESPENFYEALLIRSGRACQKTIVRKILTEKMSRRRRARALKVSWS